MASETTGARGSGRRPGRSLPDRRAFVRARFRANLHRLAEAPGNVALSTTQSRLPKRTVVNVSQIVTLDESFLGEKVWKLDEKLMRVVDARLRLVLSLR